MSDGLRPALVGGSAPGCALPSGQEWIHYAGPPIDLAGTQVLRIESLAPRALGGVHDERIPELIR